MAFIDGDKRTYVETYEAVLPLLKPGGFMLADNTLWDGHVTDPAYDRDQQTLGIRRFNDHLVQDARVEQVILPLRDGLTLIRKIED
jgi:predicted O-methyltransferase YrrM